MDSALRIVDSLLVVVGAIVRGVETGAEGVYNLAGDGALGVRQVAAESIAAALI